MARLNPLAWLARQRNSLQTRTIGVTLAVVLVSMGALTYHLQGSVTRELERLAQQRLEGLAQLMAQRIDDDLRRRQDGLHLMAASLAPWLTGPAGTRPAEHPVAQGLAGVLGPNLPAGSASTPWMLVRRDGSAVYTSEALRSARDATAPEALLQRVLREGQAIRLSHTSGVHAIWLGQPVVNTRGEVLGGLLARVEGSMVGMGQPDMAGQMPDADRVAVLDRLDGLSRVTASLDGWPPQPLPAAWRVAAAEVLIGQPRSVLWQSADQLNWMTGLAPVPGTQWVLAVSRPSEVALQAVDTDGRLNARRVMLMALALGTLSALLVGVVLHGALSPLRKATAAIDEQARRGQSPQPLRVEGGGEVQILVEAFNRLSDGALQREAELMRSRDFTRELARNIPGLFAYWSRDLRCEFINLAYAEHLGCSVEQAEGQTMDVLLPPEQRLNLLASVNAALMGIPQTFEQAHVGRAGSMSYFLVQYLPQTRGALVSGFFSLMTDITEQRQKYAALEETEGLLRAAQFTARMAAFVGYMRSGTWRGPPPLQDLLGLPPGSLLTTDTLLSLVVPESRARVRERLYEVGSRQGRLDLELQIQRPRSGKPCWLHLVGASSWSPQRRELVLYGTLQDVSERKLADAMLVQARRDAVVASRAKSQFLGQMGQDIRAPAERLLTLTRLLDATPLDARQQQWLGQARATAESLVHVIDSVQDLSQIERGALTLVNQPFLVQDLLEGLARSAGAIVPQGVSLHFDIRPDLPQRLSGDGPRLQQALHSLLATALRSVPSGEVLLQVEMQAAAPGLARLAWTVSNTGPGLAAETLTLLREPAPAEFDLSLASGLPLPLLLCRHLVQAMGGLLEAPAGDPGNRLSFSVELGLPGPSAAGEAVPVATAGRPGPGENTVRIGHVRALEPCATGRALLQRALGALGAQWSEADSVAGLYPQGPGDGAGPSETPHEAPHGAPHAAQDTPPDLLLLCARTPDLPHVLNDLTARWTAQGKGARPAIALLGYVGDLSPARRDTLAQWVDLFLMRPVWEASLAMTLAAVDWQVVDARTHGRGLPPTSLRPLTRRSPRAA